VSDAEFLAELKAFEGRPVGPPFTGPDAVNAPMIRHWCDAMGDTLAVYTDEKAAEASVHGGVIAPPTMMQVWEMRGYRPRTDGGPSEQDRLLRLLEGHGFTSVVATDCEQEYHRELRPGDVVTVESVIDSVSGEKATALGAGHFVTSKLTYRDAAGETVATQLWRILKFKPGTGRSPSAPAEARPLRPRPSLTKDNTWWFDGLKEHRLLIQRCSSCGVLRHPPRPMCDRCGSLEWQPIEASGRGTVYSFVVNHYPQVPAFDYPLPIGLIELEEGTRLIADLVGSDPAAYKIGLPVEVEFIDHDPELTLPAFHLVDGS
jgi:uncharacterized OB-fold protein